jgi:hypothetical protein
MPNGGNWDRFWFTIMGFRAEYGRWPTRVLWPEVVEKVVEAHLTPDDHALLKEKLTLIPWAALAAEDETGAHYDYAGPAGGGHHAERLEWFRIEWNS